MSRLLYADAPSNHSVTDHMNSNIFRRGVLTVLCLSAVWLAACNRSVKQVYEGIDISGAEYGKEFVLKDPDGRDRRLADFRGQAVLVFFGFTQCPDVCPTALSRAANVKQLLGPDGDRLQVIFVSLDPERDTPEVLKAYTGAFDSGFLGLYSTVEGTARTAEAFKIFYKKVPTGSSYTMDHSTISYLYDPQGALRVAVQHELSAQQVAADVQKVLKPV